MKFLYLIFYTSILQLFTKSSQVRDEREDWGDHVYSWLLTAVVIAVGSALVMLAIKWLLKSGGDIHTRTWGRSQTIIFMAIGVVPSSLAALLVYLNSTDFQLIIGWSGLLNGILVSWIIYMVLMFVGHIVGSWRNDIF
ncbi:MAG: hypothetical protein JNN15_11405 [Blastocatellia bacterium]|nr:hypothetical protein [Blastocatellia bacterium]